MNILCIDQYSELGGAQRMLLDLLPSFSERGWTIQAALPGSGPLIASLEKLGYVTYKFHSNTYTKVRKGPVEMLRYVSEWPKLSADLLRIVRNHATNLIYANGPRVLPAASWVARRCSLPLVFHCHHRLHQRTAIQLAGNSLQYARARVIACCRFAIEPLKPYISGSHLRILYNGVAAPTEAPTGTGTGKIRRIAVIGRIEEEKGQLQFVRAARSLYRQFPEIEFTLIGAPVFSDRRYLDQVQAAAARLPVTFEGWKENMADVFPSLDLVVVPSSQLDATPRVVVEALAAGIPVVAFAVGGIPEIIRDMETGFLVQQTTPEALAERIAFILGMDRAQLARIVRRARQDWQERYSLSKYRQEVGDFIQQIGMAA
jgi:glycosyltransferase involved in cell wall biosynthesis